MEWDEVQAAIEDGKRNAERAKTDLPFARQMALASYKATLHRNLSMAKHGRELDGLLRSILGMKRPTRLYFESSSKMLYPNVSIEEFARAVAYSRDLAVADGRKKLPFGPSIVWLARWWIGQGKKPSNVIYNYKSKSGIHKPSKFVLFLYDEFRAMRIKATKQQIHNTLRREDVSKLINEIKGE